MKKNSFELGSFNPLLAAMQQNSVSQYDNEGAMAELQKKVDQGKTLNLKFYTGKDGYPYAWVEESGRGLKAQGFKYMPDNIETVVNLFIYLWSGQNRLILAKDTEDNKTTPIAGDNFQLQVFKMAVGAGLPVAVKPAFLTKDKTKVYATLPLKQGTIMFSLERTEELEEFLEHPSLLAKKQATEAN